MLLALDCTVRKHILIILLGCRMMAEANCIGSDITPFQVGQDTNIASLGITVAGIASLKGHTADVSCLRISNTMVCSGGYDGAVRIWDSASYRELLTIPLEAGRIHSVVVRADERMIAAGDDQGRIHVIDMLQRRPVRRLLGQHGAVSQLEPSRDLKFICCTQRGTFQGRGSDRAYVVSLPMGLALYDAQSFQLVHRFGGRFGSFADCAFDADGFCVFVAAERELLKYNASSGMFVGSIEGSGATITCVECDARSGMLAWAESDGGLWIRDAKRGKTPVLREDHRTILDMCFCKGAHGPILAVGDELGGIAFVDCDAGQVAQWIKVSTDCINALSYREHDGVLGAATGGMVVSGSYEQGKEFDVKLLEIRTAK